MINISYDGSLKFDTKIDTDGFTRGTNTIKSQANGLKKMLAGLGKAMIAAFSVVALINFGKQAVNLASDLAEVQNVVDTAFGDMAYKIEDFAESSIENFGLSKLAAKQMASTYMAMSTGMGQFAAVASDMAVEITGRLGDVMSFYNKTQSEADTIGKAIYTGETEPLKAIGVVMTEANLSAFALEKGMSKLYSEMSSGEKLLVRQQFFLDKTSLSAGDFVKTADSWANQTRVLSERWKEFLSIIGNGLIQVLTPMVKLLNEATAYMITFAETAGRVISTVFGLNKEVASTANNTNALASNAMDAEAGLTDMGDAAKKASQKANGLSGIDNLNNITEKLADNTASAADSLIDMSGTGATSTSLEVKTSADTTALEISMQETAIKIKEALQPVIDALDRLKISTAPFVKNVGEGLKWFYDNVLVPFGTWVVSMLIPAFLDTLGASIGVLNEVIEVLKPYALWLWDEFLQPLAEWTGAAIIEFLKLLTDGLNALAEWIKNNQDTVAKIALAIGGFFAAFAIVKLIALIVPFVAALGSMIASGTLLSTVLGALGAVFSAIFSPITIIAAVLGMLIYTFIDLYKNSETFRESVSNMGRVWLEALQPIANFIGTVLSDAWNKILKPVIDFFINTLIPNLITIFKKLWEDVLIPFGTFVGTILKPIFSLLADVLMMVWKKVVLPLAEAIGGVFKKAWDGIYEILTKTVIPIIKTVIKVLTWLWENVINPIIKVLWENLKPAFETVFDAIGAIIKGLGTALGGVIDLITGVFTGNWKKAWEGVKAIFKGVFDALVGIVKAPINLIIDIINGMVNGIVSGVNAVIKAINGISFTVPDWIPGIGGKKVGFNIPTLTAPKIPKLATGTVIPPNSEFMAILGDQTSGVNIEAPLDTIVEAFKKVGGGGNGNITLNVHLNGKQIYSEIVKQDKEYANISGHSAFAM